MFERKVQIGKVGYIGKYPREIVANNINNSLDAGRPLLTTWAHRNIPCPQPSCPLESSKFMYGLWDSLLVPQSPSTDLPPSTAASQIGPTFVVEGSQGSRTHEQRFRTVSEP